MLFSCRLRSAGCEDAPVLPRQVHGPVQGLDSRVRGADVATRREDIICTYSLDMKCDGRWSSVRSADDRASVRQRFSQCHGATRTDAAYTHICPDGLRSARRCVAWAPTPAWRRVARFCFCFLRQSVTNPNTEQRLWHSRTRAAQTLQRAGDSLHSVDAPGRAPSRPRAPQLGPIAGMMISTCDTTR